MPRKTTKRAPAKAEPVAPPPPPTPTFVDHQVGAQIELAAEDQATLSGSADPLQAAITRHSNLRRAFLRQEQMVLAEIAQAESVYQSALIAIGMKHGIKMGPGSGQNWNYGGDSGVLTRLG